LLFVCHAPLGAAVVGVLFIPELLPHYTVYSVYILILMSMEHSHIISSISHIAWMESGLRTHVLNTDCASYSHEPAEWSEVVRRVHAARIQIDMGHLVPSQPATANLIVRVVLVSVADRAVHLYYIE